MDKTLIVIALIIAVVVIVVVYLLRDRLLELSVDGKTAKMEAKMEAKAKASEVEDENPVGVLFKGNKVRGEGEYRMQNTDFSKNDVDGKNNFELGYDEIKNNVQNEENQ